MMSTPNASALLEDDPALDLYTDSPALAELKSRLEDEIIKNEELEKTMRKKDFEHQKALKEKSRKITELKKKIAFAE